MNPRCLMMAVALVMGSTARSTGESVAIGPRAQPDWVQQPSPLCTPACFHVVASELWATPDQAINNALASAAKLARDSAAQVETRIPGTWSVSPALVNDYLVREQYLERVARSYGTMYRAHLLVDLSPV